MSYFQSLRHALFASRTKALHLRSHRCRGAAAKSLESRLEPLEKRIALDASGDAAFQRPLLTQNQSIYLYPGEDASQGPLPVVFGKSDIVGNDTDSFIVTGVVNGVVEKWDAASKTWQDVSTKPTSSNPLHLLKLLSNRHVRSTDRVRWVPDSGTRTAAPSHAFTSLAWNTGSETDSDCPERTVTYVSSSVQASGSVNGDSPASTASQTTESTCSCGCPTASEPVGNFTISPTETGGLKATWDSAETEPTLIPAIYENVNNPSETVSRDGWGLMISSDKRFEASDLVWHEGLQRFFTVSDDGGYLASFKFDGSTATEVGGLGDFVPDRYWQIDLAGLLNQGNPDSSEHRALEKMHIGQSTGFEGLAFKNSDLTNPDSMIIYIGAESEWDRDAAGPKISNKIIAYDLTEAFNADGSWKTSEGKQPGKVRQIYDLGYAHKETTGSESNDPMPVVDENNPATFAGGLEALTFVPDPTHPRGGLFYAGRQADGKVYKIDLQENMGEGIIGTAKVAGKFTFDSIRNPNYPDLGSLQYVELNGSQHLLALFGEGPKTTVKGEQTPRDHLVNPDPVRIVLSNLDGHVTQVWDQEGNENSFSQDSDHWLAGLRGPEGLSYFHVGGVPYLAISQDPGSEQRDQGADFAPTDDGRIGLVKFFSGFNLEQPQVTSSIRVNDEITVAAIKGSSFDLPAELKDSRTNTLSVWQTGANVFGARTALNVGTPQVHSLRPFTVVIRHGHDWNEDDDTNYGDRATEWAEKLEAKQKQRDITSQWLYDGNILDPISDGGTLGLPKEIAKSGDSGNFRLNREGTKEANSYAEVLPEIVEQLGGLPISRIMVDSYRRPNSTGTPNPLDTVLPFILGAQAQLDVDLVVRNDLGRDNEAWMSENVIRRMQPTVNDGSLLIVSTVQALWDPSKKELQEDSILGKLNEQYGISEVYLQGTNWHNVNKYENHEGVVVPAGQVNFEAVSEPRKGTTIYVYGDLVSGGDQEASPENEVWVFHQNAESRTFNEGYRR